MNQIAPKNLAYDVEKIRRDFPILSRQVHGHPLVFLDNAASIQKPTPVLEKVKTFYETEYANVHRGVHYLSQRATEEYEGARERVRAFMGAGSVDEIVFTKGATEAINLVASSYGSANLAEGDEIVLSYLEHHSNIVPWQLIAERTGAVIKPVPIDDNGDLIMEAYENILSARTKIVAITHMSNALGVITPIKEIIRLAHEAGAVALVDGCQAAPHMKIDVRDLDADFYVFSGHKVYAPTGIGALYAKAENLAAMPPYQGGGDMINRVTFEKSTWAKAPAKFEAGTPPIAQAVGLGAAIDYVNGIGLEAIAAHETALLRYATEKLSALNSVRIIGQSKHKAGIVSFTMVGAHPHDIGTIVDRAGVAVRAGHHCAQPLMDHFGVTATTRASFAMYNTFEEVDALADALRAVQEIFG